MRKLKTKREPDYLRPIELGEELGLSLSAVYLGIREGDIPHVRIRGAILIPRSFTLELAERARASVAEH